MNNNQKSVFVDDEVASQVIDIVREAQQYAIIITPYLKLWRHPQTALELAAKKGVQVTVIVRSKDGAPENPGDIPWLLNNGIRVLAVESLHAKIYLNENRVFVTSMNLLESSMKSSLEIGLAVQDPQAERQIRDYVNRTVMPLTKPVSAPPTEPKQQPVSRAAQPQSKSLTVSCIRCAQALHLDPTKLKGPLKPLCDDCYDKWAQYENEDYPERFCHLCGKPSEVTYARPLCGNCYWGLRDDLRGSIPR